MHKIEYSYRPVVYMPDGTVIEAPEGTTPTAWGVYRTGINGLSMLVEEYSHRYGAERLTGYLNALSPAVYISWKEEHDAAQRLAHIHNMRKF